MLAIVFLGGLACVVAGVALWSVPAALVTGGAAMCALSLAMARGQRRAVSPPPGGDD